MTAYEALQKLYDLDASLDNLRQQLEDLTESIPQLKANLREAQVAAMSADSGFQRFLNRLSGKGEEEKAALDRAVRTAAAEMERTQKEQSAMKTRLAALEEEQSALGSKETLMAQLDDADRAHFLRLEAGIYAESALHFLRKCQKELEQAQYYARNPMMYPGEQQQENFHKAAAGDMADQCRKVLETICSLGFPLEIHPYIQNPMGYIVTARRYGDQDQMNKAQEGIRETESTLKELLLQLAE